ncbi:hypothetical protein RHGRI_021157 [Rhododendron griersonianum]|uniref:Uncharacterized protein n=1 Tax=Rhododendron griersonianum TaxID=479676 RepID=A0AAV6JJE8_9ERIC|nr:hypothetical protein RHGRI_021157 [Rhododendron griersonianum]
MAGICCYGSAHPTLVHSLKSDFHKKLLKLAVTGLTELLRIFSSGNGRLDTEYSVQENGVPVSNIDDVVMTLKLDYENSYFVTGIFTSAIYLEDCLFEDPTIKFRGTKLYSRNLKLLVPFFDSPSIVLQKIEKEVASTQVLEALRWKGAQARAPRLAMAQTSLAMLEVQNQALKVDLHNGVAHYNKLTVGLNIYWTNILMDCNSETSFVSATWKLRTFLRLPWRPLISVNGSTVYELDDNFRLRGHFFEARPLRPNHKARLGQGSPPFWAGNSHGVGPFGKVLSPLNCMSSWTCLGLTSVSVGPSFDSSILGTRGSRDYHG